MGESISRPLIPKQCVGDWVNSSPWLCMVTGYTHLYPYHMHLILAMARGFGMQKKANLWESSSSSCIGITHINQAWVTGLHRAPCIFSSVPLIHTTPACCKVLAYLCSSSHSMRTLLEMFDARPGKQQQTRIDLAWTHTHTHTQRHYPTYNQWGHRTRPWTMA